MNTVLLYEEGISGKSHTPSGCNPCFHPYCLMVSLSPCPQAQQPGVSPPRLSGTFTHLQSSHKVKDYNSVLNQFDLEVPDGRFVWSCGPRPPTINLLKMMLSLNHQQQPEKKLHLQHQKLDCEKFCQNSHKVEQRIKCELALLLSDDAR